MKRQAFTLVELVVVVLILGILAGVAAPRFLDTTGDATEASVRQSLSVVRDAIELFTAQNNGALPLSASDPSGASTLEEALEDYLRGGIPVCPVGTNDNSVSVVAADTDAVGANPATAGWVYSTQRGVFVCGFGGPTPSDGSINYDQL